MSTLQYESLDYIRKHVSPALAQEVQQLLYRHPHTETLVADDLEKHQIGPYWRHGPASRQRSLSALALCQQLYFGLPWPRYYGMQSVLTEQNWMSTHWSLCAWAHRAHPQAA